ncbi:MAG: hypothetical protein C0622_01980 [Desulfuromonas sp.]|nr:MAG: hypothetical protein C0622_01980 [Desulfuromonas sp.]
MRRYLHCGWILVFLLYGCASGPDVASMVTRVPAVTGQSVAGTLVVGEVSGGKETNPMWMSTIDDASFRQALFTSLERSGLFEQALLTGDGEYRLDCEILAQEVKPGFDMSATLMVRYQLSRAGETVWAENIFTQYEAKMEETFYGVKRAQLANEGAVRKNIAQLIQQLQVFLRK